jgi:MFS family permease
VPGGRVAEVVGAKRVFGGAVLINGALALLLPFLARTHWILLLVTRALQGLAQVRYVQTNIIKTCHVVSITGLNTLSSFDLSIYLCIIIMRLYHICPNIKQGFLYYFFRKEGSPNFRVPKN